MYNIVNFFNQASLFFDGIVESSGNESQNIQTQLTSEAKERTDKKLPELPNDVLSAIFSYLGDLPLCRCRSVCTKWKVLATQENLWIRLLRSQGSLIGIDEWRRCFDDVGEVPPLPKNIFKDLFSPCPIEKGKLKHQTHCWLLVPSKIHGLPFSEGLFAASLKLFHEEKSCHSVKTSIIDYKYAPLGHVNFKLNNTDFWINNYYTSPPIEKPYWVCIVKKLLENSINVSYEEQEKMVSEIEVDESGQPLYEMSLPRDLFIYHMMHFALFGKHPLEPSDQIEFFRTKMLFSFKTTSNYISETWLTSNCKRLEDGKRLNVGVYLEEPHNVRVDSFRERGYKGEFLGVAPSRKIQEK